MKSVGFSVRFLVALSAVGGAALGGCGGTAAPDAGADVPDVPAVIDGGARDGGVLPDAGSDAGAPDASTGRCGDGTLGAGEVCDDGNVVGGDGCSADCQSDETCGNGTVDPDEACDDGNTAAGDGCSADCQSNESCGNGTVDPGETCDDGNVMAGDGCSIDCASTEACGNGILDAVTGEACDDGNVIDGDGCQSDCRLPSCGDAILDAGELCDDGNNTDGDGCSATCMSNETCGNGIVDLVEACDDGNVTNDDGCSATCALEVCGDAIVQASETCDDGNTADGDGCSASCASLEVCGNAIVDAVTGELCDDGNTTPADGCSATCRTEVCGNAVVDPGESCDDGNAIDGDGCSASCAVEFFTFIDPVAGSHPGVFVGLTQDDTSTDVTLPFAFPYWNTATSTSSTTTIGFGTNGALRMGGGYTFCCNQTPLWTFGTTAATIHAHGTDGYQSASSNMYFFADATKAVFTWTSMNYCCVSPGGWSVQVILYPSGNWSIFQIGATTATGRTVSIGYSDGLPANNAIAGATGLDWDAITIGSPFSVGTVDFGSSEAGGMATNRLLTFSYDSVTGYTATVRQ